MTHTPGPWTVRRVGEGPLSLRIDANGTGFAVLAEEDAEADARLIAAAPELLAAAKEAFQFSPFHTADCEGVTEYEEAVIFDQTRGCTCFLSRLRAAIAKAEAAG